MRFPFVIVRYSGTVPAGQHALNSDTLPADDNPSPSDVVLAFAPIDTSGVAVKGVGAFVSGPPGAVIFCTFYFWEEAAGCWVSMEEIELDTDGNPPVFVSVPLPAFARSGLGTASGSGAPRFAVILTSTTPPAGKYVVCLAPILGA